MNIDGAFAAEKNSGAMGVVARDDAGDFLMAMIRRLLAVASTLAAEAEARLRAGVQLIHSVTQGAVILETDSLELVGLWNNKETQRSEFTPIFSDIQEMSSGFSTSFNVLHARRSANKAAHVVLVLPSTALLMFGQMPLRASSCKFCKMIVIMSMIE